MAREVQCGPEDFGPLILSEELRGNAAGSWAQPPSDPTMRMRYRLDIEAIKAEFELPGCIRFFEAPDGGNAVACAVTRCAVGGGPAPRGWLARRRLEKWWTRQRRSPRRRKVFAPRDPGGAT